MELIEHIAGFLWGPWTPWVLLAAGVLFTIWTRFTQYTAMTHGFAVVRGLYDDPDDPGAINHFQALSAALSATVGLGNIAGVALAIGFGGPGALFWMWVVGFFGMALKTVEITLAMIYRNTDDPNNPHGGAMWVVEKVIGGRGGHWKWIARVIGVFFCVTLLISAMTGGNMFQAWSVAELSETYFGIPRLVTGLVMAGVVGMVIIGGIQRIGSVAGKLVPFMCVTYVVAALAVLAMHVTEIPALLGMIVTSAFKSSEATGAFLGGSMGFAFMHGMKRALFSNEAGQGSAPIAHAAAKTAEPAREGIVGGIGPFIDTLCICTITALVILSTGTWNRKPMMKFDPLPVVVPAYEFEDSFVVESDNPPNPNTAVYLSVDVSKQHEAADDRIWGTIQTDQHGRSFVRWDHYAAPLPPQWDSLEIKPQVTNEVPTSTAWVINAVPVATRATDENETPIDLSDDKPLWSLMSLPQAVEITEENRFHWENLGAVFVIVNGDDNTDTGTRLHAVDGKATLNDARDRMEIRWGTLASRNEPVFEESSGLYRRYEGANLTAHAFDRQFPGLGKWLVTAAAWLFAISTIISWSYYGEQGVIYMVGNRGVLPYKFVYLLGTIYAAAFINETKHMIALMDLGTGAMLWSNIPIVLALGFLAVRSLNDYGRRLKAGEFKRHDN